MKEKLSQLSVPTLPSKRPVDWVDVDGVPLRRFASGTDAGDFLGVSASSISQCVRGKTKTAGGATVRIAGIEPTPSFDQIPLVDLKNVVYAGLMSGLKKSFFSDPVFLEKARQAAEQVQSQNPSIPVGKSPGGKATKTPKDSLQNLGESTAGGDLDAASLGIGYPKSAEIKRRGPKSTAEVLSSALAASMMKKPESPSTSPVPNASSLYVASAGNRAPSPVIIQVEKGKDLKASYKPSAVLNTSAASAFLSNHPLDQSLALKFLPRSSNSSNNLIANTSYYHEGGKSTSAHTHKSDDFSGHIPDFDVHAAAVNRLIKTHTPENTLVTKEARAAFARAAGLFIFYLTHCANDICKENKRKTIQASDISAALSELEFNELIEPMENMLEVRRIKESTSEKRKGKAKGKKTEGEEEEEDAEGEGEGVPDADESFELTKTSTDVAVADEDKDGGMVIEKNIEDSDDEELDDEDADAFGSDSGPEAMGDGEGDGDNDIDGMDLQEDGLLESDSSEDEEQDEENDNDSNNSSQHGSRIPQQDTASQNEQHDPFKMRKALYVSK